MTDIQAREQAKQQLKALRYSGNEYFWINDFAGVMVMHPISPDLESKNLFEFKDPTGFRLFAAMVETAKSSGEGLVRYQWAKPGKSAPQPKFSYVKGFEPWGWIVGTGIYVDDLDELKKDFLFRGHSRSDFANNCLRPDYYSIEKKHQGCFELHNRSFSL